MSSETFNKYNKEDVFFLKFYFVYINTNNEIEKVTEDVFELNDENILSVSEICAIIERNKIHNNIHYSLSEMIKYNYTTEPEDIISNIHLPPPSLIPINNINDITFSPTILFFQTLNCIYILFKEKIEKIDTKKTRKRISFLHNHRKRTQKTTSI